MSLELSAASLLISKPDRILRPRNQVESSCQGKTNKQKQKLSRIFQKLLNLRREKSEFRDFKKGFDKTSGFQLWPLKEVMSNQIDNPSEDLKILPSVLLIKSTWYYSFIYCLFLFFGNIHITKNIILTSFKCVVQWY